jgi:hypothetical protein
LLQRASLTNALGNLTERWRAGVEKHTLTQGGLLYNGYSIGVAIKTAETLAAWRCWRPMRRGYSIAFHQASEIILPRRWSGCLRRSQTRPPIDQTNKKSWACKLDKATPFSVI